MIFLLQVHLQRNMNSDEHVWNIFKHQISGQGPTISCRHRAFFAKIGSHRSPESESEKSLEVSEAAGHG
jgi:hypothetical protein